MTAGESKRSGWPPPDPEPFRDLEATLANIGVDEKAAGWRVGVARNRRPYATDDAGRTIWAPWVGEVYLAQRPGACQGWVNLPDAVRWTYGLPDTRTNDDLTP